MGQQAKKRKGSFRRSHCRLYLSWVQRNNMDKITLDRTPKEAFTSTHLSLATASVFGLEKRTALSGRHISISVYTEIKPIASRKWPCISLCWLKLRLQLQDLGVYITTSTSGHVSNQAIGQNRFGTHPEVGDEERKSHQMCVKFVFCAK